MFEKASRNCRNDLSEGRIEMRTEGSEVSSDRLGG